MIETVDWNRVEADLDEFGHAVLPTLLNRAECQRLVGRYTHRGAFRSRVVMGRHGFGQGEYQYFARPLPEPVATLRAGIYPPLAAIANRWHAALNIDRRYPPTHQAYLAQCHATGQTRPTPLLLKYRPGDYNRLHQDLYGDQMFPLQLAVLLSEPNTEFAGGEFVLTEQRARMQSQATVVPLGLGDAVVFPVRVRPMAGVRGPVRVNVRHGVSRVRDGQRYALGVIFHDAA